MQKSDDGQSCLHHALMNDHVNVVKTLVAAGGQIESSLDSEDQEDKD